jgi:tRNA pseudouridine55 synthase
LNAEKSGIILLHKPSGLTSFSALGGLKKKLGHGKVGHAGTLDKFAEGLLIAAAGSATRLLSLFEGLPKTYRGTIEFGKTTDTLDPEGIVLEEAALPDIERIRGLVGRFTGPVQQIPPIYSALHIEGRRASDLARSGRVPEMKARDVVIHRLEILDWRPPFLTVEVECSKGTYMRSLARDLGKASGSVAYLQALTRSAIGPFLLDEAVAPDDFDPERDVREAGWFFRRMPGIEVSRVKPGTEKKISHGVPFSEEWLEEPACEEELALFDEDGCFLACVYREKDGRGDRPGEMAGGGKWKYRMVSAGTDRTGSVGPKAQGAGEETAAPGEKP